jgi:gliding motility-associated-like protein
MMKNFHRNIPMGDDPVLHGLDKSASSNPFSVPDGYFDKLSSDILNKTSKVTPKSSFKLNPLQIASIVFTAAAIVTLVYILSTNNNTDSGNKNNTTIESTQNNLVYPEVVLLQSENEPVVYIPASENNKSHYIVINPDAPTDVVAKLIAQLPFKPEVISFVSSEYSRQRQEYNNTEVVHIQNQDIEKQLLIEEFNQIASNNNAVIKPCEFFKTEIANIQKSDIKTVETELQINYFNLIPKDTCSEFAFELSAFVPGKNHYLWSTGDTTSEIVIEKTGVYQVTVTMADGSKMRKGLNARIIPIPELKNDYLITGCSGASLFLTVEQKNTGYAYRWPQLNLNAPQVTIGRPGLYIATIKGCKMYSDSFMVIFTHCDLNIPNVVSPNGDGINETFLIDNIKYYPNTELYIYNRSNQLVFQSKNYQNDWDASTTPDGSYFYLLRFPDGITQEGLITVQRR